MKRLLLLLLIASPAIAQTGSMQFDLPWSSKVVTVASLIPLRATTSGVAEISGQAQPIALVLTSTPTVINITFPGQKASSMTIVGFRIKGAVTASWKMSLQPDQMITPPIVVPAGKPLFVKMEYGLGSDTGSLKWAPDFVSLNPAPPPIVITPQPTPQPPPVSVIALSVLPSSLVGSFIQNAPCSLQFTISNSSTMFLTVTWADNIPQLLDLIPKAHQAPVIIPASGSTAFTLTCDSGTKGTFSGVGTITSGAIVLSLPISWVVQ